MAMLLVLGIVAHARQLEGGLNVGCYVDVRPYGTTLYTSWRMPSRHAGNHHHRCLLDISTAYSRQPAGPRDWQNHVFHSINRDKGYRYLLLLTTALSPPSGGNPESRWLVCTCTLGGYHRISYSYLCELAGLTDRIVLVCDPRKPSRAIKLRFERLEMNSRCEWRIWSVSGLWRSEAWKC
jgi:hypothetical protein